MTDRRVKVKSPDGEECGDWVDTIAIGETPYAVVVTDDGKIIGAQFKIIDLLPDSANFKE